MVIIKDIFEQIRRKIIKKISQDDKIEEANYSVCKGLRIDDNAVQNLVCVTIFRKEGL